MSRTTVPSNKKSPEAERLDFKTSAQNLIGSTKGDGFIRDKDGVARVKRVIGYLGENTSNYDSEKMSEIIWVASRINLVRDLRKITTVETPVNPITGPMRDHTNFVVGLAEKGSFNASAIKTAIDSIPEGATNDNLHKKLSETKTMYDLFNTEPPSPPPSPSPAPVECCTFFDFIASKITNLVGKIFDSSAEKKPAPEKTPSTTCKPKGFIQLAGEMLKRMGSILSH